MNIQHNLSAMKLNNNLTENNKLTAKSMEKLATGLRINLGADEAAGLSISEKMRTQIRGLEQAQRNIQDGISFIQTAESGLAKIADPNLHRLRQLSVQAASDTLSSSDKAAIQNEVNQILRNIDNIADNTEFNGINLLNIPGTDTVNTPEITSNQSDIIFIVDRTGSMGADINRVEANIKDFATALQTEGVNIRLGLVSYGETNNGDQIMINPFTGDVEEFKGSLTSIEVGGGGDIPESGLEGIKEALRYPFRADATKQFILVTDAPVHDNNTADDRDGGDGLSVYDIDDLALSMSGQGIKLTIVGPTDRNTKEQLQRLSEPTGGNYLDIKGNFSTQLQSLAADIAGEFLPKENIDLKLQIGANAGETFGINLSDVRTAALGIENMKVDPWEEAMKSIEKLDAAIQQVSAERGKFGAYENALRYLYNNASTSALNLTAAESRIRDTDMAKEIINLTKNSILAESTQAMLAQANRKSQQVLELLK
ncbi:flagellin N-terminal helical domain-containing protein [Planomicrobium okeanokoites]|uniref:Flagellin n=1 Tax=Planomicrobium okeanokoites TaxID=244 RepID=A0ABV7KK55_PLAOK|nr:flagellin [Planomicrobium okeanokoites]TAA69067.1 VWA domain-containing protein [Planomicrobium okeanokoites]